MGYLANFMVYTLAMVGVIVVALLIFKNSTNIGCGKSSKHLKIVDTLPLGQRKNLYIVTAGSEQFLIAGDTDRTTLISKLNSFEEEKISAVVSSECENYPTQSFKEMIETPKKQSFMDKSSIGIKSSLIHMQNNNSVMKNLAERIRN